MNRILSKGGRSVFRRQPQSARTSYYTYDRLASGAMTDAAGITGGAACDATVDAKGGPRGATSTLTIWGKT